jgi:hypothetical protein
MKRKLPKKLDFSKLKYESDDVKILFPRNKGISGKSFIELRNKYFNKLKKARYGKTYRT